MEIVMILCDTECFEILDSAYVSYRSKLKEAKHIIWEKTVVKQTGKARKHFNNFQSANYLLFNYLLLIFIIAIASM